MKNFSVSWYL